MIKVSNIDKYYFKDKPNEIHVLNDVSLELPEYGLVTILGPSGSGKSTLLNVIGGLDKAKGKICYGNIDINNISKNKFDLYRVKHIGYIFQNYNLIHELSVYDNLKLQLELVGELEQEDIDYRINNSLKVVGMDKYKRRNVTALSGGQQQRVAIARALVKGSKVIIADEPTGNLDSKNSVEVMNLLKVLSKRCLIVLVTHDTNLAMHYSDRIIKIKDGKIIEDIINDNDNSLLDSNSINSIYLDQYNLNQLNGVQVFTKKDSDLKLRIVFDGMNLYVENKADVPIKVIGDGTDKILVEKTPEKPQIDFVETTSVDFPDINFEARFSKKLLDFFKKLKNGFLNFFFAKKKTMALNFGFFLIGVVLCLCICSLSYCTYVEEAVLQDDPVEAIRVHPSEHADKNVFGTSFEYRELVEIITSDNGITSLVDKYDNPSFEYNFIGDRMLSMSMGTNCFLTTPTLYGIDLELVNNEMVISDIVADKFIEYFYNFGIKNYSDLIGIEMRASFSGVLNKNIIIKDIVDMDNKTFFVSDELFFSYRTISASDNIKMRVLGADEELANLTENSIRNYNAQVRYYASSNLKDIYKTTNHTDVIGYFDSEEFELVFRNKQEYSNYIISLQYVAARLLPYKDVEITKGNAPSSANEILLPDVLDTIYSVGSRITKYESQFVVSGFFNSKGQVENAYVIYEKAYLMRLSYVYTSSDALKDTIDFYTIDRQKSIDYFKECGYQAHYVRDYLISNASTNKINASQIAITVSVVVVVVMILFIFFISRSKMLKSVYTIGVYRSLGSKKSKIYLKYIIDGFVMATCTVTLGFTLMYLLSIYASGYLPGVTFDFNYFLLIVLGIYAVMIFASILPIILLLRKTPIEILGKYDI